MAVLLVNLVIIFAVFFALQKYGNLQPDDVNVMVGGSLLFSSLNLLSQMLVALFTTGAGVAAIAYFIGFLLNGLIAYFFLKRAGII